MRYIHILIIMLLVSMASCGNDEEFVINCEIRGLGSKGVEMYYTTRSMQRSGFHPVGRENCVEGSGVRTDSCRGFHDRWRTSVYVCRTEWR